MMQLRVHLFARARELAGTGTLVVPLEAGATVARLRARLAEQVPALAGLLPRCAVAVDRDFRQDGDVLPDGAEVAILPPVSGGAIP